MNCLRGESAHLDGEIIKVTFGKTEDYYNPFKLVNLPNAFAKVIDGKTALRFSETYGFLGWPHYVEPERRQGGEPLSWVLNHASTVKLSLKIIAAIADEQLDADEQLESRFQELLVPELIEDALGGIGVSYMVRDKRQLTVFFPENRGNRIDYKDIAQKLLIKVINKNTESVREMLQLSKDNIIVPEFQADSLLDVIYWHVGRAALSGVRSCKECGTPFVALDKRQKYCPGDEFSATGSLCGLRARVRKSRKNKEVSRNGR